MEGENNISLTSGDSFEVQQISELDREMLFGLRSLRMPSSDSGEYYVSLVLKLNQQKQKFLIGLYSVKEKEECNKLYNELRTQLLNPETSPIKYVHEQGRGMRVKGNWKLKDPPDKDYFDYELKLNEYVDLIRELFAKYEKSNITKTQKPSKEI